MSSIKLGVLLILLVFLSSIALHEYVHVLQANSDPRVENPEIRWICSEDYFLPCVESQYVDGITQEEIKIYQSESFNREAQATIVQLIYIFVLGYIIIEYV